jgi:putative endonuclease
MGARMKIGQDEKRARGERAEAIACAHLEARGFAILGRNVRVGRKEIDLIARRGSLLVFCEVRSRSDTKRFEPLEAFDPGKRRRVREAAAIWLTAHRVRGMSVRFDAAAVSFDGSEFDLDYVEDAF